MSIARQSICFHAVIASVATMVAATPVNAQFARTELSIVSESAVAGTMAGVSIRSNSQVSVGALQFDLTYDPSFVQFKGVENGPLFPAGLVESNVVQPGRARIALVSNEGIKGDGVLLTAEFDVLVGSEGKTSIGLDAVRGWDLAQNLPVNIASHAGDLTRTTQQSTPAADQLAKTPVIWIYLAAGVGAIALIMLLSRRVFARRGGPTGGAGN